jgi:hypothetical protein
MKDLFNLDMTLAEFINEKITQYKQHNPDSYPECINDNEYLQEIFIKYNIEHIYNEIINYKDYKRMEYVLQLIIDNSKFYLENLFNYNNDVEAKNKMKDVYILLSIFHNYLWI